MIEAFQFCLCKHISEFPEWIIDAAKKAEPDGGFICFPQDMSWIKIKTLEGEMKANVGDWIIKGTAGELYPCKDSIFQEIYEKVEEENESETN